MINCLGMREATHGMITIDKLKEIHSLSAKLSELKLNSLKDFINSWEGMPEEDVDRLCHFLLNRKSMILKEGNITLI